MDLPGYSAVTNKAVADEYSLPVLAINGIEIGDINHDPQFNFKAGNTDNDRIRL